MFSQLTSLIENLPLDSLRSGNLLSDSVGQSADTITGFVSEMHSTYEIVISVVMLVLALVGCFLGYKLCRIFMSLTGFIVGAVLGYIANAQFLHADGILSVVCVLVCGAVLAALACWIYRAGIFILCFALGFTAAASFLPTGGDLQFFLSVLVGLVIGVLAVKFLRPVIILTSAIVGGVSAASLLPSVAAYMCVDIFSTTLSGVGLGAVLSILGILVQFLTTKEPGTFQKSAHKHD